VCAEERKELSLPAAAGGLKTMGYGRMATHRPGGVLPGGHSPSTRNIPLTQWYSIFLGAYVLYSDLDHFLLSMVFHRTQHGYDILARVIVI
jgi:hypothetical protein